MREDVEVEGSGGVVCTSGSSSNERVEAATTVSESGVRREEHLECGEYIYIYIYVWRTVHYFMQM